MNNRIQCYMYMVSCICMSSGNYSVKIGNYLAISVSVDAIERYIALTTLDNLYTA